ncbi:MAG: hypothetical protein ACOYMW_00325 [Candidatus Competibacteraceae bacterium]
MLFQDVDFLDYAASRIAKALLATFFNKNTMFGTQFSHDQIIASAYNFAQKLEENRNSDDLVNYLAINAVEEWEEKLRELWQQDIERRARRRQKRLRLKQLYQHETLEQKVQRLAGNSQLDYDKIRLVIEADLALANPTPARIRERREWIARLIGEYRQRGQWQNKPFPMTQEERKALYRKGAARMHPDRAENAADYQYRNMMMAILNKANDADDGDRMRDLLHDYELRPKATTSEEQDTRLEFA